MKHNHYRSLFIMILLSFITMYILMYAMVNALGNVYNSINEFYMAGLMTAPMVLIELFVMGGMYENKRLNLILISVSAATLVLFFLLIRQQSAVSDKQFLRSMIPHHAGAILMCEQASLEDPEIVALCQTILTGQQAEIDQMKEILQRLENQQ